MARFLPLLKITLIFTRDLFQITWEKLWKKCWGERISQRKLKKKFQTRCLTSSNTHTVGMSLNCYVLPALSWLSCNKGTIDIGDSSVKQKQQNLEVENSLFNFFFRYRHCCCSWGAPALKRGKTDYFFRKLFYLTNSTRWQAQARTT